MKSRIKVVVNVDNHWGLPGLESIKKEGNDRHRETEAERALADSENQVPPEHCLVDNRKQRTNDVVAALRTSPRAAS